MRRLIVRLDDSSSINKLMCRTASMSSCEVMLTIMTLLSYPFKQDRNNNGLEDLREQFFKELRSLGIEYVEDGYYRDIKRIDVVAIIMNRPIIKVDYELRRGYKCKGSFDLRPPTH